MAWLTLGIAASLLIGCAADDAVFYDTAPTTEESDVLPENDTLAELPEGDDEGREVESIDGDHDGDGHAIVEGDMILVGDGEGSQGIAASTTATRLWPGGIVPYTVDASLPNQQRVTRAIEHWRTFTGIRFVQRTNQTIYVRFVRGNGCSSYVGRVGDRLSTRGRQDVTLADGCSLGNTIHEIGHAIGLMHEQSRLDRDRFVDIHPENMEAGRSGNFTRVNYTSIGTYDFDSLMHYGSLYFSRNGRPTMTKKDGSLITPKRVLSEKDIPVARLYAAQNTPGPAPIARILPRRSASVPRWRRARSRGGATHAYLTGNARDVLPCS